jgi:flagellar assembly protein FliH
MDSIIRDIPNGRMPRRLARGQRRMEGEAQGAAGPEEPLPGTAGMRPPAGVGAPGAPHFTPVTGWASASTGPSFDSGATVNVAPSIEQEAQARLREQIRQLESEAATLSVALNQAREAEGRAVERASAEAQAELQRACAAFEHQQREALQEELAAVRASAYAEGWASGQSEGHAQASARAAEARARDEVRFGALFEQTQQALAEYLEQAEDHMVEIAYSAACRLVGQAQASAEGVAVLVRQALDEVRERKELTVALHPEDLDALQACVAVAPPGCEFVADPAILLGGCEVRSQAGTLDARLELQLARLAETLLAVRAARREAGREAAE